MKQINTISRLCKEAHRNGIGHVYDVAASYNLNCGPTVAPITSECLASWPHLKRHVAARLGVTLGRAIR